MDTETSPDNNTKRSSITPVHEGYPGHPFRKYRSEKISYGEFALSIVRDFVNKSASRSENKSAGPDIPNRNLKSELSEMKENLGILLRRLE